MPHTAVVTHKLKEKKLGDKFNYISSLEWGNSNSQPSDCLTDKQGRLKVQHIPNILTQGFFFKVLVIPVRLEVFIALLLLLNF